VFLNLNSKQKANMKGHISEWIAAYFLRLKGFQILEHRYKTPVGEIDILMKKGNSLIAVEVKNRKSIEEAAYSVTPFQKRRIERALLYYLTCKSSPFSIRFDVVLIAPLKWPCHIQGAWNAQ